MQLKSIILFALGVAAAQSGWQIPQDQPDGVYSVSKNADGSFEHTQVATSAPARIRGMTRLEEVAAPNLDKRQISSTCQSYSLDPSTNNLVFGSFISRCPSSTIGDGLYVTENDVVVYWCNYGSNQCNTTYAHIGIQTALSARCGSFVAGWYVYN